MIFTGCCVAALLGSLYFCCDQAKYISRALTNLIVGYLMASFANFLIDSPKVTQTWWYQIIFVAIMFGIFILFPTTWAFGAILMSAAMGTYAIIQAFMIFIGTHSSYFVINTMRAVSVKNYIYANTTPQLGAIGMYF